MRYHLVQRATDLFSRYGYQAIGVDAIAERAGVSKRTLYRYFDSKDKLILAVLDIEDARIRNRLLGTADNETPSGSTRTAAGMPESPTRRYASAEDRPTAPSPLHLEVPGGSASQQHGEHSRERLRRFFAVLEAETSSSSCQGCLFQMAISEYPDRKQLINQRARAHKSGLEDVLRGWIRAVGFRNVEGMLNRLRMLVEGAWATARMTAGQSERESELATAAFLLIESGLYAETLTSVFGMDDRPEVGTP